ncbi:MAG: hypothetical protein DMF51_14950 [Acidobacteria bacterium]|nr:MAG: hypothetical protein DMF51_14950 [Acidobacteriota bacterium]
MDDPGWHARWLRGGTGPRGSGGAPRINAGPPDNPLRTGEPVDPGASIRSKWASGASGMFPSAGAPVVIGVLGDDSLRQALERLASGKRIDGRPILVTSIARPSSLGMCHILFIGVSESARLREALAETRGRSVLTVGESEHFVETGGVLELALVEAMVRFKVNLEVADRDGLRISSKILALGEVLGNSRAGRRP